jgi:hypothetical protein
LTGRRAGLSVRFVPMKALFLTVLLVALNVGLAMQLDRWFSNAPAASVASAAAVKSKRESQAISSRRVKKVEPETEFAAIYSNNPKQFVTNLRAIGCPEETIKDILVAEVSRRYAAQENALRPTPGDHVPFGWSSKTVEGKLIARRHDAAAIAREKSAGLRDSLGYDVPVRMHQYAMTTSDEVFQRLLETYPVEKRAMAQQVHENYWAEATALRNRTRGFWLREDVEELNKLKARREEALERLKAQ